MNMSYGYLYGYVSLLYNCATGAGGTGEKMAENGREVSTPQYILAGKFVSIIRKVIRLQQP